MILDYITSNYPTLLILFSLIAIRIANRNTDIPAAGLLDSALILLFVMTFCDSYEVWFDRSFPSFDEEQKINYLGWLTFFSTVRYIIQPVIILLELHLLIPGMKHLTLLSIPAVVNAVIYGSSLFTGKFSFYFDEEGHFHRGIFGLTIFIVTFGYVILLIIMSVIRFKRENLRRSIIVLFIVAMSVIASVLEYTNILSGYSTFVVSLSVLIYYAYLSSVYQKEMQIEMAEKELEIARDNLLILRGQIQPHFIFNSLSIIRSLTKKDKDKAIEAIDSFSDYLKAHVGAMQSDEPIPLEKELYNVKAYLSLVQADYTRKVEVVYDIRDTDLRLPPLSLEPLVENAVKYGIGRKGGTITISSFIEGDNHIVRVRDSGNSGSELTEKETARLGVGVENTRKRLAMQCGGDLVLDLALTGSTASIVIPVKEV